MVEAVKGRRDVDESVLKMLDHVVLEAATGHQFEIQRKKIHQRQAKGLFASLCCSSTMSEREGRPKKSPEQRVNAVRKPDTRR